MITVATIQGWLLFEGSAYCNLIMITMATIQGWLLFEGSAYCNVIMITVATIQKPGSFMVQIANSLFVI